MSDTMKHPFCNIHRYSFWKPLNIRSVTWRKWEGVKLAGCFWDLRQWCGSHTGPLYLEWPQPAQASLAKGLERAQLLFSKSQTRNRKLLPFLSILSQRFLFCFKKHSLSAAQPFPCPQQPDAQTHPQPSAFLWDCSCSPAGSGGSY